METVEMVFESAKLGVAIVGAIGVAWYWNRQKHLLDQYCYVDESYKDILGLYFQYPQFGDSARTRAYAQAFKEQEAAQYHYFAMRVHTLMETIFDISKGDIAPEWTRVFQHHTGLHLAWLRAHAELHDPRYVALVLRNAGELA